jgi:phosphoribosylanthranilate isomerase
MTWIKICGITSLEDAVIAVDAGADAVGFVFYEKSPRKVDLEVVREIVARLPERIEKVGVFVDKTFEFTEEVAESTGLTAIQLHPDLSTTKTLRPPELSYLKRYLAIPARCFLNELEKFESFTMSMRNQESGNWFGTIFLDSGTSRQPGGTGSAFDWQEGRHIAEAIRASGFDLVVAGGLTPDNVTEAMRILKPWGVDVSSGVEASPGKKDPKKVRAFINAVRQAENIA